MALLFRDKVGKTPAAHDLEAAANFRFVRSLRFEGSKASPHVMAVDRGDRGKVGVVRFADLDAHPAPMTLEKTAFPNGNSAHRIHGSRAALISPTFCVHLCSSVVP
ncbi:MAG TPA: hypothetical protein VFV55_01730, partial [Usitatibacteraceae bacterium]|nr:hypothetical protein [Usitatibacteraceae bacterium]